MSESLTIDFLYKTPVGRFILKGLVNPKVSKRAAKILSSRMSAAFVPSFIKKNNIDIEDYIVPEGGFGSFNDFFTRKIKPGKRAISDSTFICPSDGLLTVSEISETSVFNIKNTSYSLKELLASESLAGEFMGGTALIFRLTPSHYHRYVFCASGKIIDTKYIQGILHSVKPVCHETFPVFIQNSREYAVIDSEEYGKIVQMEVGALLVGKISNSGYAAGDEARIGEEKGYFEYGGSSIVVLTKRRLCEKQTSNEEMPVKLGMDVVLKF
jgi:phosphatidylserine decarboxylase